MRWPAAARAVKQPDSPAVRTAWAVGVAVVVVVWWTLALVVPRGFTMWSSDLRITYLPLYEAFYGRLARGHLPLWNPHQLCGLPWLGTLQGGFFYPPHILYLVLPLGAAAALSGLVHLLLLALSTTAFARAIGTSPEAAALAALVFTLCGVPPTQLFWPPALEALAWLPLGALAVVRITGGDARRGIPLLALATGGSVLAGFPQMTVFLGYAWTTLLVAMLLGTHAVPRRWAFAGGSVSAALALGLCVGAAAVLPGVEMTRVSVRAARAMAVQSMFPLGSPGFALFRNAIRGPYAAFAVVPLSLVPAGMLAGRNRAVALWAGLLGAVTFAFALGPSTPLFQLYLALPALSMFRAPNRILVLTQFAVAILAAIGLDGIATGPSGPRTARALSAGVSVACALVLAALLTLQANPHAAFGIAAAAAIFACLQRRPVIPALVGAVAIIELLLVSPSRSRLPYNSATIGTYRFHARTYRALAGMQGASRVWIPPGVPWLPALAPKLASVYGVRSIDDYEAMTLWRQAEYFTYATEGSTVSRRANMTYQGGLIPSPALIQHWRLLDMAALWMIAVDPTLLRGPKLRSFIADVGLVRRTPDDAVMQLFENPTALPRAFVVYRVRRAPPSEELLRQLSAPAFDPLVESFVEDDPGFVAAADAPARGEAARFVRDEAEVVELDVTAAAPGLLVLADSFYPGWRATVDGVAARILATNHLFRGVPVPAGRHRVRFAYRPWTVSVGVLGSLAGALGLMVLLLRSRSSTPARNGRPGRVAA